MSQSKESTFLKGSNHSKRIDFASNISKYKKEAFGSIGKKSINGTINISTISSVKSGTRNHKDDCQHIFLLTNNPPRSNDRNKRNEIKKNILVFNKTLYQKPKVKSQEKHSDTLIKELNDRTKKKQQNELENQTDNRQTFISRSKEIINLLNMQSNRQYSSPSPCKIQTEIDYSNKQLATTHERKELRSRNFSSLQPEPRFKTMVISTSNQRIEKMKKYINDLFPHQNDKSSNQKDIFEPSYQRKITNRLYDFKKFKIFVDINERKENPEKLKLFAKNNLNIITSIQTKFAENRKECSFENIDEDINVDDLLDDNTNGAKQENTNDAKEENDNGNTA